MVKDAEQTHAQALADRDQLPCAAAALLDPHRDRLVINTP